jgi:hypothetical protein
MFAVATFLFLAGGNDALSRWELCPLLAAFVVLRVDVRMRRAKT